jgi:hypothetical protein
VAVLILAAEPRRCSRKPIHFLLALTTVSWPNPLGEAVRSDEDYRAAKKEEDEFCVKMQQPGFNLWTFYTFLSTKHFI